MLSIFLSLVIIKISLSQNICIEGKNNCTKCNPISKKCVKCDKEIFVPDENGGCKYSSKCEIGKNYCYECNDEGTLCKICSEGYIPDENGGCTYTSNCEISYKGNCLKCKDNFILIGEEGYLSNGIKICKSLDSENIQNCEKINMDNGICEKCADGYYLNKGDKKCNKIEKCFSAKNGICQRCIDWYYLDRKEQKCKEQHDDFFYCKESYDGTKCDICNDDHFLINENTCVATKYCSQGTQGLCEKCISGYFLSKENNYCVSTQNCFYGDKEFGICYSCKNDYFYDYKDFQCKSNKEDNEFKYCQIANGLCYECINNYFLGEDKKCSPSKNCVETKNGICQKCKNGYHLGVDNKCTDIEHCIYSNPDPYFDDCYECDDNYYFNKKTNTCVMAEGIFKNCKRGDEEFYCYACKNDFYINQTDHLCYNNNDTNLTGGFYKCSETDSLAEGCIKCTEGYYLGRKDHNCSTIPGCAISQNVNECLECEEYYCFNDKTKRCEKNDEIISEEKMYYYRCNKTNSDGNGCEICNEGFSVNKNGICVDDEHCIDKNDDGSCKRCQNDDYGTYCVNKYFGCEIIFSEYNCLECNDIFNFNKCTKCFDGFELNENDECIEIKK